MKSIQTRLAGGLLISLIVLLLIQWIIVAISIRRLSEQYIASRLIHTSDTLAAAVTFKPSGEATLNDARMDPVFSKPFSGHYYLIKAADVTYRSRSLWDETLPAVQTQPGEFETQHFQGPENQHLLAVSTAYNKQGAVIQITVAEDISGITADINTLLKNHAGISLVILIMLIGLQVVIVRTSLRPLEKTRRDLIKLEQGLIQTLQEDVPREIHALVHEINVRIAAFRQRLERSRRATGNLAHALKGPLTLLTQLSQDSFFQQRPDIRSELEQHLVTIRNIVDRELKRARLAGTVVGAQQTRLKPEVSALVKTLQSMYRDKNLRFNVSIPEQCVSNMDREDFHEMMGNILDNACKWAAAQIKVTVNCDNGLLIIVEDDGGGIPEAQRNTILSRGKRLDEHTAGHGLGLAIVKDIIDQYNGHIIMKQSDILGGLRTEITIPISIHNE
ncbi:MAG: ATP-binding protein [Gammaproteobacteria bacterium]|jgi:signal transduction histidine kinase